MITPPLLRIVLINFQHRSGEKLRRHTMCRTGSCGGFDDLGYFYFTILALNRQPKMAGVTKMPIAGMLIDPEGNPVKLAAGETVIHAAFPGHLFSVSDLRKLINRMKEAQPDNSPSEAELQALFDTAEGKLPAEHSNDPIFARALAELTEPQLSVITIKGFHALVVVKPGGEILRYGTHPTAGVMFSILDAVEQLHRFANEGIITWGDHARLQTEVLSPGAFPELANGTPESILFANAFTLDVASRFPSHASEIREQFLATT